jgi:hypothetical protein
MKLRQRARLLKWAASRHPAMAWPAGSWFVDVPPMIAYDLAKDPDATAIVRAELRPGGIMEIVDLRIIESTPPAVMFTRKVDLAEFRAMFDPEP